MRGCPKYGGTLLRKLNKLFEMSFNSVSVKHYGTYYLGSQGEKASDRGRANPVYGGARLSERRDERQDRLARLCDCRFQKEVLLKKFSKISPNKKYEAMVYQCLGQFLVKSLELI